MDERVIRKRELLRISGHTHSSLYRHIKLGLFPAPFKLGGKRAAGWLYSEVMAAILARANERKPRCGLKS